MSEEYTDVGVKGTTLNCLESINGVCCCGEVTLVVVTFPSLSSLQLVSLCNSVQLQSCLRSRLGNPSRVLPYWEMSIGYNPTLLDRKCRTVGSQYPTSDKVLNPHRTPLHRETTIPSRVSLIDNHRRVVDPIVYKIRTRCCKGHIVLESLLDNFSSQEKKRPQVTI